MRHRLTAAGRTYCASRRGITCIGWRRYLAFSSAGAIASSCHPNQDLVAWRVTLNRSHVALWARWCVAWLAWVGWALILGAHLHPRWDEILFAISLPCFVLLPYMIATFILACIKLFLPIFVTFTHAEGVPRRETVSNGDAIKIYNQRRADPRIT